MKYDKLVRDKVPHRLIKEKKVFSCREALKEEYLDYVDDALLEHVNGYLENRSLEALAEVLEVVYTLSLELGYTIDELMEERIQKEADLGAYYEGIILEEVKEDD